MIFRVTSKSNASRERLFRERQPGNDRRKAARGEPLNAVSETQGDDAIAAAEAASAEVAKLLATFDPAARPEPYELAPLDAADIATILNSHDTIEEMFATGYGNVAKHSTTRRPSVPPAKRPNAA